MFFGKQSRLLKWIESAGALALALIAAIIIRQVWFELYEIPTGSMRPTYKEQDHLTVSKTQFGINTPLATDHLYFDPELVERTGTIIFSGDGLPVIDSNTTFLGVIPYKKRYVKRMIGKPEDAISFYGGRLYGLDKEGKELDILRNSPWMQPLEYVPFLSFEGQPERRSPTEIYLNYFQIPFGRIQLLPNGIIKGEVFNGKEWVEDHLDAAKTPHDTVQTLSDLFGIRNFGMAELYRKEELLKEPQLKALADEDAPFYLVIRHTPNLDFSKGASKTFPNYLTTALPISNQDLDKLAASLYTGRFVVEDGKARRYSADGARGVKDPASLPGVPDGTYEFYYGKAYKVGFGGITSELEPTHPLYERKLIPTLYNLGIQWDKSFLPGGKGLPSRYTYFRDGSLYLLGAPFLEKGDPKLQAFVEKELKKQESSGYVGFIDRGPSPFHIKVPPKHYLVLGDNHANSGDSRVFGFVPEANLQGVPEFIFWPPGDRLGRPAQEPYQTFVLPRLLIWTVAALAALAYFAVRKRLKQ